MYGTNMAQYDYPPMTEEEIITEIKSLEEGQKVAFVAEDQNRNKDKFTYTVSQVAPNSTVDVSGPEGGHWRFAIEEGHPQLRYKGPSSGWRNAGILDYVEGQR